MSEINQKIKYTLLFILGSYAAYKLFWMIAFVPIWGLADAGADSTIVLIYLVPFLIWLMVGYKIFRNRFGKKFAVMTIVSLIAALVIYGYYPAWKEAIRNSTMSVEESRRSWLQYINSNLSACYRNKDKECIKTWEVQRDHMMNPANVPEYPPPSNYFK